MIREKKWVSRKNVEWEDDQYTPLRYAAQKGDLDVVEELIEKHGVPVDIKTGIYQRTPSTFGCFRRKSENGDVSGR